MPKKQPTKKKTSKFDNLVRHMSINLTKKALDIERSASSEGGKNVESKRSFTL